MYQWKTKETARATLTAIRIPRPRQNRAGPLRGSPLIGAVA